MSHTTPNLALPYLMAAQAQKHVTHNEAIRALDALVQVAVLDRDLATPPGEPGEGSRYIVAAGASAAWTGHSGKVAAFQDGAWAFYAPRHGWVAWVCDEGCLVAWNGTAWIDARGTSPWSALMIGVNTAADATNRLSVKSDAVLLSHDDVTPGTGHVRQVLNKKDAAHTASLLFQDDFSGRAEVGLAGDDNLHFKVSADGSTWKEGLVIERTTGTPRVPSFDFEDLPSASTAGAGAIVFVPDDEAGPALYFSDGTGWLRGGAAVGDPMAAMPTFSPDAGDYGSAQTVTISTTTPGATIHYTTNGSTPTGASPTYSGPITVSANQTVKAIAVAAGYEDSAVGSAIYTIRTPAPLFLVWGESNAGGFAPNDTGASTYVSGMALPTTTELTSRSVVQILNNGSLAFEDMQIGVNNFIGHTGFTSPGTHWHGLELQLANAVALGRLAQSQVYLVKSGHGGSRVSDWHTPATNSAPYWALTTARIDAAVSGMRAAGREPVPVIITTIGICDALNLNYYGGGSGSAISDWSAWGALLATMHTRLRDRFAANDVANAASIPVLMTKFEAGGGFTVQSNVNTQLAALDTADAYAVAVGTAGAGGQADGNHWTYQGYKLVMERILDAYLGLLGNAAAAAPGISPAGGAYGGAQTVSITAPGAIEIRYTTSGAEPLGPGESSVYSGTFSATPPATVKAVAIETGKPSSAVTTNSYTASASTWNTSDASGLFELTSGNTVAKRSTDSGYNTVRSTTSKASGKWWMEVALVGGLGANNGDVLLGFLSASVDIHLAMGYNAGNYAAAWIRDSVFNQGMGASGSLGGSHTVGDVYNFALDMDAGKVWIYKNGTILAGDPVAGTGAHASFSPGTTGALYFGFCADNSNKRGVEIRAGGASQTYSPPSGFTAWG